ncbi:MAG: HD domain-containing protein [Bacteroidota bacterium]
MLSPTFEKALHLAFRLHQSQARKVTGVPYFSHLMAVSATVLEYGGDEETAIAALLHDAVEDQGGTRTLEEIRRKFGDRVARIVSDASDAFDRPRPPWRERKRAHIAKMREASGDSQLVVAADKLHNIKSIQRDYHRLGNELWKCFTAGKETTLWYYRSMCEALSGNPALSGILAEVRAAIDDIEHHSP